MNLFDIVPGRRVTFYVQLQLLLRNITVTAFRLSLNLVHNFQLVKYLYIGKDSSGYQKAVVAIRTKLIESMIN